MEMCGGAIISDFIGPASERLLRGFEKGNLRIGRDRMIDFEDEDFEAEFNDETLGDESDAAEKEGDDEFGVLHFGFRSKTPFPVVALNSFGHTHLMWESKTQTWKISAVLAPTPTRFDLFEGGDSSGEVVPVEDDAAIELSDQLYAYDFLPYLSYEGSLDASIDGQLGYELMQEGVHAVDLWSFDDFPWESKHC